MLENLKCTHLNFLHCSSNLLTHNNWILCRYEDKHLFLAVNGHGKRYSFVLLFDWGCYPLSFIINKGCIKCYIYIYINLDYIRKKIGSSDTNAISSRTKFWLTSLSCNTDLNMDILSSTVCSYVISRLDGDASTERPTPDWMTSYHARCYWQQPFNCGVIGMAASYGWLRR